MDINVSAIVPRLPGISEEGFCVWLGSAAPGDILIYHRGFLALDCAATSGQRLEPERGKLARLSRQALRAAELGLVHLLQQRHGPCDYSYLAVVRPRKRPVPASIPANRSGTA